MCGRYALHGPFNRRDPAWVAQWLEQLISTTGGEARYNIAPSQAVPAYVAGQNAAQVRMLRWGLIPAWAKDAKMAWHTINARAETVVEKPAYRGAWRAGRRCVIPASGWYEWLAEGKLKQPWYVHPADDTNPVGLAGLWDSWRQPDGTPLDTCTIITVAAGTAISPLHDRQPLVLDPARWQTWLHDTPQVAADMLRTPEHGWTYHKVSRAVNTARTEGPALLVPIE